MVKISRVLCIVTEFATRPREPRTGSCVPVRGVFPYRFVQIPCLVPESGEPVEKLISELKLFNPWKMKLFTLMLEDRKLAVQETSN